jgi:hypothetical protein
MRWWDTSTFLRGGGICKGDFDGVGGGEKSPYRCQDPGHLVIGSHAVERLDAPES